MRKVNVKDLNTFGDLYEVWSRMVLGSTPNTVRVDLVFDAYINGSVKDSERIQRAKAKPMDLTSIDRETPLPIVMDTFRLLNGNKEKLQRFLIHFVTFELSLIWPFVQFVLSGVTDETHSACHMVKMGKVIYIPELDSNIEEADIRLIVHALHAAMNGMEQFLVLPYDIDVLVALLHHMDTLKHHGLKELCIKAGVGDN